MDQKIRSGISFTQYYSLKCVSERNIHSSVELIVWKLKIDEGKSDLGFMLPIKILCHVQP